MNSLHSMKKKVEEEINTTELWQFQASPQSAQVLSNGWSKIKCQLKTNFVYKEIIIKNLITSKHKLFVN